MDSSDCSPVTADNEDEPRKMASDITEDMFDIEFPEILRGLKLRLQDGRMGCVLERQNTMENGMPVYFCYPCSFTLVGTSTAKEHLNGRKHYHRMKNQKKWPIDLYDHHPFKEKPVADSIMNIFQLDLTAVCLIQPTLDALPNSKLIGLEYMLEILPTEKDCEPGYQCLLCSVFHCRSTVLSHFLKKQHKSRYLLSHFPTEFKAYTRTSRSSVKNIDNIISAITEKYGRLSPVQCSLQDWREQRCAVINALKTRDNYSEKLGHSFIELLDRPQTFTKEAGLTAGTKSASTAGTKSASTAGMEGASIPENTVATTDGLPGAPTVEMTGAPIADELQLDFSVACMIRPTLDEFKSVRRRSLSGLEYLVEILPDTHGVMCGYYCVLCSGTLSIDKVADHFSHDSHKLQYLSLHFPTVFSALIPGLKTARVVQKISNAIEKKYGRMLPVQCSRYRWQHYNAAILEAVTKRDHFSENMGETFMYSLNRTPSFPKGDSTAIGDHGNTTAAAQQEINKGQTTGVLAGPSQTNKCKRSCESEHKLAEYLHGLTLAMDDGTRGPVAELWLRTDEEKVLFFCYPCCISIRSIGNAESHIEGKKHYNVLKSQKIWSNVIYDHNLFQPVEPGYERYVVRPGSQAEQAAATVPVTKPPNEFQLDLTAACAIQPVLNNHDKNPIIGLEYLVEIVSDTLSPKYYCFMCCTPLKNPRIVMKHLATTWHSSTYLSLHFNTVSSAFREFKKNHIQIFSEREVLNTICGAIEKKYGRMLPVKCSQLQWCEYRPAICEAVKNRDHFTEKPDLTFTEFLDQFLPSVTVDISATGNGYGNTENAEKTKKTEDSSPHTVSGSSRPADGHSEMFRELEAFLRGLTIVLKDGSSGRVVGRRIHGALGRLVYLCYPCGVTLGGYDNSKEHFMGKKHLLRSSKKTWPTNIYNKHPSDNIGTESHVVPADTASATNSPQLELDFTATCVIQPILDSCKSHLWIGVEYLLEIPLKTGATKTTYYCILCSCNINKKNVLQHFTKMNHKLKYLSSHFPTVAKAIEKFTKMETHYQRLIDNIIYSINQKYGHMRPVKCTQLQWQDNSAVILEAVVNREHFSEKTGQTFMEVLDQPLRSDISSDADNSNSDTQCKQRAKTEDPLPRAVSRPRKPANDNSCLESDDKFAKYLQGLTLSLEDGTRGLVVEPRVSNFNGKLYYLCYPCSMTLSERGTAKQHLDGNMHCFEMKIRNTWPRDIYDKHPFNTANKGRCLKMTLPEEKTAVIAQKPDKFQMDLTVACVIQPMLDSSKDAAICEAVVNREHFSEKTGQTFMEVLGQPLRSDISNGAGAGNTNDAQCKQRAKTEDPLPRAVSRPRKPVNDNSCLESDYKFAKYLQGLTLSLEDGTRGLVLEPRVSNFDGNLYYLCYPCSTTLPRRGIAKQHLDGNTHCSEMKSRNTWPRDMYDNHPFITANEGRCPKITFPEEKTAVIAQKPDKFQMDLTVACVIQPMLDSCKDEVLIGLEYLVEILANTESRPLTYYCVLCSVPLNCDTVREHYSSEEHKLRYLSLHFKTFHAALEKLDVQGAQREKMIDNIFRSMEKSHGRMLPMQCTQFQWLVHNPAIRNAVIDRQHFSDKMGPSFKEVPEQQADVVADEEMSSSAATGNTNDSAEQKMKMHPSPEVLLAASQPAITIKQEELDTESSVCQQILPPPVDDKSLIATDVNLQQNNQSEHEIEISVCHEVSEQQIKPLPADNQPFTASTVDVEEQQILPLPADNEPFTTSTVDVEEQQILPLPVEHEPFTTSNVDVGERQILPMPVDKEPFTASDLDLEEQQTFPPSADIEPVTASNVDVEAQQIPLPVGNPPFIPCSVDVQKYNKNVSGLNKENIQNSHYNASKGLDLCSENPGEHSHYNQEGRKFLTRRYTGVNAENKNPYDFTSELKVYREKRKKELDRKKLEKKNLEEVRIVICEEPKIGSERKSLNEERSPPRKRIARSRSPRRRPPLEGRRSRSASRRKQSALRHRTSPRRRSRDRLSPRRASRMVSRSYNTRKRRRSKSRDDFRRTRSRDRLRSSNKKHDDQPSRKESHGFRSRSPISANCYKSKCSQDRLASPVGSLSSMSLSDDESKENTSQQREDELLTEVAPLSLKQMQLNVQKECRDENNEKDDLTTLEEHLKNPEQHPQYNDEWKKFWTKRYMEFKGQNKDPTKHNFNFEWMVFWSKRMVELHEEKMEAKKNMIQKGLDVSLPIASKRKVYINPNYNQETSPPHKQKPQSRSPVRKSRSPLSRHKQTTRSRSRELLRASNTKGSDNSITCDDVGHNRSKDISIVLCGEDIKQEASTYSLLGDNARSVESARSTNCSESQPQRMCHEAAKPSSEAPGVSGTAGVLPEKTLPMLRHLVALEDYLGPSLGPQILKLLAEALRMERVKPNLSETILDTDVHSELLEMVKEKLTGKVEVGLLGSATPAVQDVISRISILLDQVQTRKREQQKMRTIVTTEELNTLVDAVMVQRTRRPAPTQPTTTLPTLLKKNTSDVTETSAEKITEIAHEGKNKLELRQAVEKTPLPSPDMNAMDGLSDSELNTLMQNFGQLSSDERQRLVAYVTKLEVRNPKRVKQLRQFVSDKISGLHSVTSPAPVNMAVRQTKMATKRKVDEATVSFQSQPPNFSSTVESYKGCFNSLEKVLKLRVEEITKSERREIEIVQKSAQYCKPESENPQLPQSKADDPQLADVGRLLGYVHNFAGQSLSGGRVDTVNTDYPPHTAATERRRLCADWAGSAGATFRCTGIPHSPVQQPVFRVL